MAVSTVDSNLLTLIAVLDAPGGHGDGAHPVARIARGTLWGAVEHYLGQVDVSKEGLGVLGQLARAVVSSEGLWPRTSKGKGSEDRTSLPDALSTPVDQRFVSLDRANDLYFAISRGVEAQIRRIKRVVGTGWRARHATRSYVAALLEASLGHSGIGRYDPNSSPRSAWAGPLDDHLVLIPRVGILTALQGLKAARDELHVGKAIALAEQSVIETLSRIWAEASSEPAASPTSFDDWTHEFDDKADTTIYIAAQCLPSMDPTKFQSLDLEKLLNMSRALVGKVLEDGRLAEDQVRQAQKEHDPPSKKTTIDKKPTTESSLTGPLFTSLGKISRVSALALARLPLDRFVDAAKRVIEESQAQANHLYGLWKSEAARCSGPDKDIWTVFRTTLFTITMHFQSITDRIRDDYTLTTTETASDLAQRVVLAFAPLYFITSRFGMDGFPAYKAVFYTALDIVGADASRAQSTVERLGELLPSTSPEESAIERSLVTYYLNTVEQLVKILPDDLIQGQVFSTLEPYLCRYDLIETFESAHSVVLAIYAGQKAICRPLTPVYLGLLLDLVPRRGTRRISKEQLEVAVTTMTRSLCGMDDALAWWSCQALIKEIDAEGEGEDDSPAGEPEVTSSSSSDPSRRLDLILVLAAQLGPTNLVLTRSLLRQLERLLRTLERPSRDLVYERIYLEITTRMETIKKEEAIQWWLNEREASQSLVHKL